MRPLRDLTLLLFAGLTACADVDVETSSSGEGGPCAGVADVNVTIASENDAAAVDDGAGTTTAFGACLRRVVDAGSNDRQTLAPTAAHRQAWDASAAYLLLDDATIVDAATGALVAQLGPGTSWRWEPGARGTLLGLRGHQVLRRTVDAPELAVVADLPRYVRLDRAASSHDPTADGRSLAVVGERASDGRFEVAVLDLTTGRLGDPLVAPVDSVGRPLRPDWAALSPSGDHLLVQWPAAPALNAAGGTVFGAASGSVESYRVVDDGPPQPSGTVTHAHGPGDLAQDEDGTEWYVTVHHDNGRTTLDKVALPGGLARWRQGADDALQPLVELPSEARALVSCRAPGTNFCAIATHGPSAVEGSPTPLSGEVFVVDIQRSRLGAPRVRRLAHHHARPTAIADHSHDACPLSPAHATPRAVLRHDAATILFASNGRHACQVDSFELELP